MKNLIHTVKLILGLFFISFTTLSYATEVTWTGGASTTNWGDAANWSNNAVPTAIDDVTIDGESVDIFGMQSIATLKLMGGAYVTILPEASLTVDETNSSLGSVDGAVIVTIESQLVVELNATLTVNNSESNGIYLLFGGYLSNLGSVVVNDHGKMEGGYGMYLNSGLVNNTGSIVINATTGNSNSKGILLNPYGYLENYSTITINNVDGVEYSSFEGSTTQGNGTFNGDFVNGGTSGDQSNINPYTSFMPENSQAIITINGSFEQTAYGGYDIGIVGNGGAGNATGHDQVVVTEDISLNGELKVSFPTGFTPGPTDTYTIMTYGGNLTGTFSSVTGMPAGWMISYGTKNPGQIELGPASILPVALVAFDVEVPSGQDVLCKWQTASEVSSSHYAIERSQDGRNFTPVGKVASVGASSTTTDYEYVDKNVPSGLRYYRLRQVDEDGSTSYSGIRQVNVAGQTENALALYPNPVRDILHIKDGSPSKVRLYDASGKRLATYGDVSSINVSQLMPGMYIIEIVGPQQSERLKFIKE